MVKDFYTPGEVVADRLLTVEQVSKRLKYSKMTVYRYIKAKKMTSYKVGKEYRIKESDLEKFLEDRKG